MQNLRVTDAIVEAARSGRVVDTSSIRGVPHDQRQTTLIAHIGFPTEAFKAPLIYNPWFAQGGASMRSSCPWACKPDDYQRFLKSLFRLTNIRGALITMPHKVTTVESDRRGQRRR